MGLASYPALYHLPANAQIDLGGGVWRLRQHPAEHNHFVAACMQNGCAVVKADVLDPYQMQLINQHKSHESIVYDVDWVHLGGDDYVVASCSFYDNMLQFWTPFLEEE